MWPFLLCVRHNFTDTIWVSLNDKRSEGVYRWHHGVTLKYQDKWAVGQPEATTSKNCVAWVHQGLAGYRYEVRDCSERHWVVCFTATSQREYILHYYFILTK